MSVQASLARLRASTSSATLRPPPLPQPRRDMAGLALNGLETLSTIDAQLPAQAPALLLLPPYPDRATLPPEEAQPVSVAVISIAARLAPVFPMRPAQKVVSWLIHGLRVPQLGTEQEVDALMLAALPFHETTQFLELVRSVLREEMWKKWEWLRPVVIQKKPPSLPFIVRDCPDVVLRLASTAIVQATGDGINALAGASLLANLMIRRLAVPESPEKHVLVLAVVDALDKATKLKVKEKNKSELLCALMSGIAAAVPSGIDEKVAGVAAQAVADVIRVAERGSASSDTAVACLAMLVTKGGMTVLEKGAARSLVKSGTLAHVLPRLGNGNLIISTYGAVVLGIAAKPSVRMLIVMQTALSKENTDLLSEATVRKTLVRLFRICTDAEIEQGSMTTEKREGMLEVFANIVASLSKGRFAPGVDLALRDHLASRKKSDKKGYSFVDEGIEKALSGTTFAVGREAAQKRALPKGGTVLAMLTHPEQSVVKVALAKLADEHHPWKEQERSVTKTVVESCDNILKNDSDGQVAASAALCMLRSNYQPMPEDFLRSIFVRFRSAHCLLQRKKKRKSSRMKGLAALFEVLLLACERETDTSPVKIQAMLIGLAREGVFDDDSVLTYTQEMLKRLTNLISQDTELKCLDSPGMDDAKFKESIEGAFQSKFTNASWDPEALLSPLSSWDPLWALDILTSWIHMPSKVAVKNFSGHWEMRVVENLAKLYAIHESIRPQILHETVKAVQSIHNVFGPKLSRTFWMDHLWSLVARSEHEGIARKFLTTIHQCYGANSVSALLQRASAFSQAPGNDDQLYNLEWLLVLAESESSDDLNRAAVLRLFYALYGNNRKTREKALVLCESSASPHKSGQESSLLTSLYRAVAKYRAYKAVPSSFEQPTEKSNDALSGALHNYRVLLGFMPPITSLETAEEESPLLRYILTEVVDPSHNPMQRLSLLRSVEGCSRLDQQGIQCLFQMEIELLSEVLESSDSQSVEVEILARTAQILTRSKSSMMPEKYVISIAQKLALLVQRLGNCSLLHSANHSLAVVAGFAHIFSVCRTSELDLIEGLMRHMLSFSTKASVAGNIAKQAVDDALRNDDSIRLMHCLEGLGKSEEQDQEQMDTQGSSADNHRVLIQEAGMGAVDALKRLLTAGELPVTNSRVDIVSVLSLLWSFIHATTSEDIMTRTIGDRKEYELHNILTLIEKIFHTTEEKKVKDLPVDIDALLKVIFYPSPSQEIIESALMRSIRDEALQIAQVLAPHCGKKLFMRISDVLNEQLENVSFSKQLTSVHRLTEILLKSGCDANVVCSFLARATYRKSAGSRASEKDCMLIVSCCQSMPDMKRALLHCLQHINDNASSYLHVKIIAKECSRLLFAADQGLIADLSIIAEVSPALRSELALVHTVDPLFRRKLIEALQAEMSELPLTEAVANLMTSLWGLDQENAEKPVNVLISFLPLHALSACFGNVMSTEDVVIRTSAVKALSARIIDDAPLSFSWNEDGLNSKKYGEGKSSQAAFVEEIGMLLCTMLSDFEKKCPMVDELDAELRVLALRCMQRIVNRVGSSAPQVLLEISKAPLSILRESRTSLRNPKEVVNGQWQSDVSSAMDCLSSIVGVIGKRAVAFIPEVVGIAADILEAAFGKERNGKMAQVRHDLSAKMTNAALQMCSTVLDSTPKFFGRITLTRVATLAVAADRDDINALLLNALKKVPANVGVSALVAVMNKLDENSATLLGVCTLLQGLSALTSVMTKAELKSQKNRLLKVLLPSIEYGRLGSIATSHLRKETDVHDGLENNFCADQFKEIVAQKSPDGFLSVCKQVDDCCASSFTQIVLRIPEADFKVLFNHLVQWLEGGRLMTGAEASKAIDTPQYFSRFVPILRVSQRLMHVLRGIFVPYFLQLVDQILAVIGSRSSGPTLEKSVERNVRQREDFGGKKRKREKWEGSEQDAVREVGQRLQQELYLLAVENLTQFLRQESTNNILSPALIAKIQANLVLACRKGAKSDEIRRAIDALGTRIIAVGNMKESKEESRAQLIALSRAILSLAGETDANVREAAVFYCKCLANTLGDDYLVTLPEAMPVLAELIDDENDAVRNETRAFVKVMEALSGESIMDDMKS